MALWSELLTTNHEVPGSIKIIRNNDVKMNEFPLFLFSFLRMVFISWCNLFFFLLALQPPLWVVFYSPLVGFSLLACEVS